MAMGMKMINILLNDAV